MFTVAWILSHLVWFSHLLTASAPPTDLLSYCCTVVPFMGIQSADKLHLRLLKRVTALQVSGLFFSSFLLYTPPRVTVQVAVSDKCLRQARLWCSCQESESRTSPMKPFCFPSLYFFSQRGNNTQLLHSIWMTKVPTATITHRARWSISPTRKQQAIDSVVDCQSRSCLSLFVPECFNEEHMTRVWTDCGEVFFQPSEISHICA